MPVFCKTAPTAELPRFAAEADLAMSELFGAGYLNQAQRMIDRLAAELRG